jgi:hypothetical protein
LSIVLAVVLALILVEVSSRSGGSWRLITFTYQANILAAAYYAWTLCSPGAAARSGLRGAVVLYVVAAGLVWNLFLTGHSMGYTPANFLLHVAVPALAAVDWMVVGRGQNPVRWWHPFAWLCYPAAYGALAFLILNNVGRRAPYYFLDPGSVGAAAVTLNVSLLAAGFLGLGYLLAGLARATSANA